MGATNCPETPRQRMISMMYLVLTAMLALNVSVEILHGYTLVDGSLRKSIGIADRRNESLNIQFENAVTQNPQKAREWQEKANAVIAESEKLFNYITEIKRNIIGLVDGVEAIKVNGKYKDAEELEISDGGRADLNISGQVGFLKHTVDGKHYDAAGAKLKKEIRAYSSFLESLVTDSTILSSIKQSFVTDDRYSKETKQTVKWEYGVFDGMPAVATLTLLTKFQSDIRNTESQILQYLIGQIDAGDFRVNKIQALVIPNSKYIIRGGKYQAQIVLAATDSTKPLEIEVGSRSLPPSGMYELVAGSVGKFDYKGTIKMKKPDGQMMEYPFKSDYVVGEPSATISADMMNVFYAGIENPLSVSVPGVSASDVSITITNGTSTKTAKGWNIRPAKVGVECVITVSALFDGKQVVMGSKPFRVKKLPPPLAKIEYTNAQGIKEKYKGGTKIAKNLLITATRVVAELDDDDLDVRYKVLGFNVNYFDSMGNTLIETASGSELTAKQQDVFKKMVKGKLVYVSNVRATGPDGIERMLPPIEVAIP